MQKGNRMFGRWLAVMVSVALLIGQSNFPVMAEESGEMPSVSGGDAEYNVSGESSGEETMPEDMLSVSGNDAEGNICEEPLREEIVAEDAMGAAASVESPQTEDEEDYDFLIDDGRYKIWWGSEHTVELVGVTPGITGEFIIPAEVEDPDTHIKYPVASIGWGAFYECAGLTSIKIPDSVTNIENHVFYGCAGLTSIKISDSVTNISYMAFYGCTGLTSIDIPDGVTNIGESAFSGCTGLTSIDIPDGVTNISYCAFLGCTGLTSISIPDSVTSIDYAAFYECAGLTSIKIPDSVTNISDMAFYGCTKLTSIDIPDGVTNISYCAFYECVGLTSIKIPDSVTSIGAYAFLHCASLTSIDIPGSVTSISAGAFSGCASLTSIKIPDSVTSIGAGAFYECASLTSIDIPGSVTSISDGTFKRCVGLTSIDIPDSVTSIGESAFWGCHALESLTIPSSVNHIDNRALAECFNLRTLKIAVKTEEEGGTQKIKPISLGDQVFDIYSANTRTLIFLTEDGTAELSDKTSPTLAEAQEAYRNVDDGDTGDNYWYGWYLGETPAEAPVYSVTIQVYMDDEEWTDHDRTFVLYQAHEDLIVDNLSEVGAGTYEIYDVTGTPGKSFRAAGLNVPGLSGGLNTGVTVEVKGGNTDARVDYYTATFYDGEAAYGESTPQRQQIILKGYPVSGPKDPIKAGMEFQGWRTEARGGVSFDFAQAIQEKTAIYASWKEKESDEDIPGNSDTPGGENTPGGEDTPNGDDKPGNSSTSGGTDNPGESDSSGNGNNNNSYDISDSNMADGGAVNKTAANEKEPKTGDTSYVEIYATIAMIAGLLYLLLYFADRDRGMTEEEKKELVSAMIRWAKRGGRLRRYAAIAAIFCLLCYYHSIGHCTTAPKAQAA